MATVQFYRGGGGQQHVKQVVAGTIYQFRGWSQRRNAALHIVRLSFAIPSSHNTTDDDGREKKTNLILDPLGRARLPLLLHLLLVSRNSFQCHQNMQILGTQVPHTFRLCSERANICV